MALPCPTLSKRPGAVEVRRPNRRARSLPYSKSRALCSQTSIRTHRQMVRGASPETAAVVLLGSSTYLLALSSTASPWSRAAALFSFFPHPWASQPRPWAPPRTSASDPLIIG